MSARTIQIFLPEGDPQGIRIAEITTRIVRVIEVPRASLDKFRQWSESQQVGLYFLFGSELDDKAEEIPQIYIGQTGEVGERLKQHEKERGFWKRALVVISLTNNLTQTHVLYLEWLAIKEAKKIGRYSMLNSNNGNRPHTPAPLEADCIEIYETSRILLATLGYPVFEPLVKPGVAAEQQPELLCVASGANGRGIYTDEGFVVLRGSSGRRENVPSIQGTSDELFRERLIKEGIVGIEGDKIIFKRDHLFGSPSMAAVALTGRTANGWIEWKTSDGKTLQDLKRKSKDDSLD